MENVKHYTYLELKFPTPLVSQSLLLLRLPGVGP